MSIRSGSQKGFTLVELMIVVAIVGILAVVALPAYFNYILRIREADGVQRLFDVKAAQEKFYALNDVYCESNTNSQFVQMLSFNIADTQYYSAPVFTNLVEATDFEATISFDLNQDGASNDSWRIREDEDAPVQTVDGDEGFKLSIIQGLF